MSIDLPFVSVIVPVFNGERVIADCIESLLDQTYPKYEIIVVDNNSKDNTAKIVKQYPVKYLLENKIQSSYAARNKGIIHSKGDILAFIDADCVASKEWLSEGIKPFIRPEVGCVAGEIVAYKPKERIERFFEKTNFFSVKRLLENYTFLPAAVTANVFYRRKVFELIGLFDSNTVTAGDIDFSWRMQLFTKYKIAPAEKAIVYHRHRKTYLSLFKQHKRYGYGMIYIDARYRQFIVTFPIYKKIYWSLSKIFNKSLLCFLNFPKIVYSPDDFWKHFFDWVRYFGILCGEIHGFFDLKTNKLKVEPLKRDLRYNN